MKKNFIRKALEGLALGCALTFALGSTFVSCADITSSASDSNQFSSIEYGSLSICDGLAESARALDISTLTSATVTVSGYGMSDITKTDVSITNGAASASIENIPVGNNRVVTVKSNVDGATLRAVCDIKGGENTVTINWSTTALGNVFYNLIKKGTNVAEIAKTAFDSAIDKSVHASLIDAEAIAAAYPSLGAASSYISDYGTVSVKASNASGYTVQITDIASEKVAIDSASPSKELKAYPGTWKVWVLDSTGTRVAEKDITVVAGETSTVDVVYSDGSSNVTGKIIVHVPESLGYGTVYAWNPTNDSEKYAGAWPGSSMGSAINGFYTYELSKTVAKIIFNNGSGGSKGSTQTYDLWVTEGEWNYIGGKGGTNDTTGSSIASNFEKVSHEPGITLTVKSATPPAEAVKIYVSSTNGAPKLWVYDTDGNEISKKLLGETWPGNAMSAASGLNDNTNWYVKEIPGEYVSGSKFNIHINGDSVINTTKTTTFWYDAAGLCGSANAYYDSDPTTVPEPVSPTLTISPASGKEIGTASSIKVTASFGNDTPSVNSLTINGKSYAMSEGSNVYAVSKFATEAGKTITVNGTLTNSKGKATINATYTTKVTKEDPFTWDNVNAYFVLTDRFYNGDSSNDHSYNRKNGLSGSENVATFHGGDIAGLTQKLDYFVDLGVNAIWITAPYEQVHGWVSGKGHKFPHYAFHGYYTLDWTAMDQNMGTLEELRTFVNACHSKGIRVIMDVVMNHVGYNNQEDMITYPHGKTDITEHGWLEKVTASCGDGCSLNHTNCYFANYTVEWTDSYWESWWGPWISSFAYARGDGEGGSCGGLPDVRSELTESVGMAPVMVTKWKTDSDSIKSAYYNPSVANADWNGYSGDYRTDKGIAPMDYQVVWLSAWVRELGIDGFRCDTAKHVERWRWGQLKVACQAALEAWRDDSSKDKTYNGVDTGAADWDENFWMTAECFGWTATDGTNSDYYQTGKFDSVINFSFNKSATANTTSNYPNENTWSSYLSINSNPDYDSNGNRNNVLTYVSSHDTALCRASNQYEVGTMLTLLPGGVQIYYGDESNRGQAYTDCGDSDMMTRGDMDFSNTNLIAHWGKVGKFRKYNPAVGAGTGTANKRTYSGSAGENSVAISLSSTTVDVSGLFADGTTVYNWYDGKSATVSGGSVTFSSSSASTSAPVLVSDKNPANYGVTF